MVIVTADHGHSIGDNEYMGKSGYPSAPEVYEVALMIYHPEGKNAGRKNDMFVQHIDITASVLKVAEVNPLTPIDGKPFFEDAA